MNEDPLELAHTIVDTLDEKKGEDILLLDLREVCSFTDYFVISTGGSERTLKALSGEIQRKVKRAYGARPFQVEGDAKTGWILIDYGDVILHLFSPMLRAFYRLEDLWREGQVLLHMR